jgi:hypothetical protein
MVITTVPPEFPFWQDLPRCDYFPESQEFFKVDIFMVVGGIADFGKHPSLKVSVKYHRCDPIRPE